MPLLSTDEKEKILESYQASKNLTQTQGQMIL
jgi:hypothetical protein